MSKILDKGNNLFTIPAGGQFMPALAEGLAALQTDLNIEPGDITVYFPTRRAIREFQQH